MDKSWNDGSTASAEELRTLRRLEGEAKREARRRSRTRSRIGRGDDGTTTGSGGESPAVSVNGRNSALAKHPRLKRVAVRVLMGAVALLLVSVLYPPFVLPVSGPVTSRFFLRTAPDSIFLFDVEHHRGIDIGSPAGTPVRAPRSGRVISAGESPGYGLVVDVRHPLGMVTRYAHLSRIDVREGQWLWRRRRLGMIGMTGRATGPHLHFEVLLGGRSLPPGPFLMFHQARHALLGR